MNLTLFLFILFFHSYIKLFHQIIKKNIFHFKFLFVLFLFIFIPYNPIQIHNYSLILPLINSIFSSPFFQQHTTINNVIHNTKRGHFSIFGSFVLFFPQNPLKSTSNSLVFIFRPAKTMKNGSLSSQKAHFWLFS